MDVTALIGGAIYVDPWSPRIDTGAIVVEGGSIAAVGTAAMVSVPDGARVIDCAGATITSGFWNCHVHFTERKWADAGALPAAELAAQLRELTRYGFTTVFDLSSLHNNTQAIRRRVEAGEIAGPQILSTGEGMVPIGATPQELVSRMMGWMIVPLPEIGDAIQAASATRTLLDQGVDAIKVFASGPPAGHGANVSEEMLRTIVSVAHDAGKPVFLHPNTGDDVRRAALGGVDVIAHTVPGSTSWHSDIASIVGAGLALTPTLMLWKQMMRHDRTSLQTQLVQSAIDQLTSFHASGGTVLFGTDLGAVDADPTHEYRLMARSGMQWNDILASLTTAPARRFFGPQGDGTIAVGNQADIVVLNGDPAKDPTVFADVRLTMRSGRVIAS